MVKHVCHLSVWPRSLLASYFAILSDLSAGDSYRRILTASSHFVCSSNTVVPVVGDAGVPVTETAALDTWIWLFSAPDLGQNEVRRRLRNCFAGLPRLCLFLF